MKKIFKKYFLLSFLAMLPFTFVSCGGDEPSSDDSNGGSDIEVPDKPDSPSGTGTSNGENPDTKTCQIWWSAYKTECLPLLSNKYQEGLCDGYIYIGINSDGYLTNNVYGSIFSHMATILDMGPVNSIIDITDNPTGEWKSKVEAVDGHGYVIRYPGYIGLKHEMEKSYVTNEYFGETIYGYWYARIKLGTTFNTERNGQRITITPVVYQDRWLAPSLFKCPQFINQEIQVKVYETRDKYSYYKWIVRYSPDFIAFEHPVDYSINMRMDHATKRETNYDCRYTGVHLRSNKVPTVESETITVSTPDGETSILVHYVGATGTAAIIK